MAPDTTTHLHLDYQDSYTRRHGEGRPWPGLLADFRRTSPSGEPLPNSLSSSEISPPPPRRPAEIAALGWRREDMSMSCRICLRDSRVWWSCFTAGPPEPPAADGGGAPSAAGGLRSRRCGMR